MITIRINEICLKSPCISVEWDSTIGKHRKWQRDIWFTLSGLPYEAEIVDG